MRRRAPSRTGRRGAGRHADLAVRALDVAVGGLDRDPELVGDLLRLQAAGEHRDHLGLALGQPCRALQPVPGDRPPDHRGDRAGVEAARARLRGERSAARSGLECWAVRARLTHREEGVGEASSAPASSGRHQGPRW